MFCFYLVLPNRINFNQPPKIFSYDKTDHRRIG